MHFKINIENKISDFHIEQWDSKAFGLEMVEKIQSYLEKPYKDFILFALQNRLFLKTKMLFLMSDESVKSSKTVYFWACAPIYGEPAKDILKMFAGAVVDKNELKYAMFHLNPGLVGTIKFISVLCEQDLKNVLEKYGCKEEVLEFTMNADDLRDISSDFNISRNNQNFLYAVTNMFKTDVVTDAIQPMPQNGIAATYIDEKTMAMNILRDVDAERINNLEKFTSIILTEPLNKEEAEKEDDILNKVVTSDKHKDLGVPLGYSNGGAKQVSQEKKNMKQRIIKIIKVTLIGVIIAFFIFTIPAMFSIGKSIDKSKNDAETVLDEAAKICSSNCTDYPKEWVIEGKEKEAKLYCMGQCTNNMAEFRKEFNNELQSNLFKNQYTYRVGQIYCVLGLRCAISEVEDFVQNYKSKFR